jgi:mono/diheme cytochrome c family protein
MMLNTAQLLKQSRAQLDELFRKSPAGEIPNGEGTGTAIVCPGTICAGLIAWLARWFLWQGKVFDAKRNCLVNRISVLSLCGIQARVYKDKSWFDDQECIVIDYSKTSFIAKAIRDEIREVSSGLYLGQVFVGKSKTPVIKFAISFQYQPERKFWRRTVALGCAALLLFAAYLGLRLTRDVPVTFNNDEDHFKYGSTGGEREAGIPYWLWRALPELFPEYLPGKGLESVGFIFDPTRPDDKMLPVGVSKRNVQGIDRVFLNCAICHVGTVRDTPESKPRIIAGMPAHNVDLQAFERFLFNCATDEKFNAERLALEMERIGTTDDWLNRTLLRVVGVGLMRDRILFLRQRFSFMDREPDAGPGRVDTFNPPKVLLNFRMDNLPTNEWVGNCDFPSVWLQGKRKGMQLHWDGNNSSVEERNRSASFGTGATPPTLDRKSIKRTEQWLYEKAVPPPYPYPIDKSLVAKGEPIYAQYCARCHGKDGRDFTGEQVGKVTHIDEIKTDRWRLDSYSYDLCANQNLIYATDADERFKHFRKTFGYANQPLDGIWLRAPYLHNGSVPTLRELLEPSGRRRKVFYRGYDLYDQKGVGFVSTVATEKGRNYFLFDTSLPGNGNFGHEGKEYGTELRADEKDAIVEFMKTF